MPPKSSSGKEKGIAEEDEVLQAVILADSFNKRFKPLTVGKPRVLTPYQCSTCTLISEDLSCV